VITDPESFENMPAWNDPSTSERAGSHCAELSGETACIL